MLQVRLIATVLLPWFHSASSFIATSSLRHILSSTTTSITHHAVHDRTTALNAIPPPHNNNELHLLTFDLDDTIFPIGPVVADANVAQLRTLIQYGYENAANEEIIAASKQIRAELREAGTAITYSDLRKQSIRREIERVSGGLSGSSSDGAVHGSVIEAVFDAWLSERHASADRNLYPFASNALETIREEHPDAIIGAITNGRGNPLEMPSMKEYFDFCISGEDDGVFPRRKPDKGIYEAAVSKYNQIIMQGQGSILSSQESGENGFNWIHVGDDLANDVGASAACGAKSIWFTMEEDDGVDARLPSWSTATQEELRKRAALDEMAREHVSAKIVSLVELPASIVDVLSR
eukprot:CAMPEP_0201663206 /NCGR_PEP_ID=MMETSP0494-20130426/5065_1 /ASSEMBLY_ACC=CAM_ASM_000839 /TAXON_ID=420259 /ORGANISM="Thalassiosira gravida, Strain GMp14c1" /LENGTH=350 /DNA_ID=CAMNT_0048141745 /DNA_START=156 /DNA_END=1208 /DNA_ORIENTATION=+